MGAMLAVTAWRQGQLMVVPNHHWRALIQTQAMRIALSQMDHAIVVKLSPIRHSGDAEPSSSVHQPVAKYPL
jgi:hypothetical protein